MCVSQIPSHEPGRHLRPSLSVIPLTPPCLSLHSIGPLPSRPDLHLRAAARPHRPRRLRSQDGERASRDTATKVGKARTPDGRDSAAASH